MELELKRKTLKITIYGEVHTVKVPTMRELSEYRQKLESIKEEDVFETMKDFVSQFGLSRETCENMDSDDFVTLVNFVCNPKKK